MVYDDDYASDDRDLQATCPVCGYTDTALDADTLEQTMRDHMRRAHNMEGPVNPANIDLKDSQRDNTPTLAPGDVLPSTGATPPESARS